jgi:hypothetical protein
VTLGEGIPSRPCARIGFGSVGAVDPVRTEVPTAGDRGNQGCPQRRDRSIVRWPDDGTTGGISEERREEGRPNAPPEARISRGRTPASSRTRRHRRLSSTIPSASARITSAVARIHCRGSCSARRLRSAGRIPGLSPRQHIAGRGDDDPLQARRPEVEPDEDLVATQRGHSARSACSAASRVRPTSSRVCANDTNRFSKGAARPTARPRRSTRDPA